MRTKTKALFTHNEDSSPEQGLNMDSRILILQTQMECWSTCCADTKAKNKPGQAQYWQVRRLGALHRLHL